MDIITNYMIKVVAIIFLLLSISSANAQPLKPGEWRTYTAMTNVSDIVINSDSSIIWVGTSGGVYSVPMNAPTNAAVK